MKHKTIRIPASDLSAVKGRLSSQYGGQSEFLRQIVEAYAKNPAKIINAISGILAGSKPPVDSEGPKGRTAVFLTKESSETLEHTSKRLGFSFESLIGLIIHDALQEA